MERRFRLTGSADFQRVRRFGKSFAHPFVVLITASNELDKVRVAVAAGRSTGNAVQRNRAKRVLRAAIQPLLGAVLPGWDILLIARRPIASATSLEICTAVESLLRRANLIPQSHGG